MKLSEERKTELREVKECCKVNLPEFKERYNSLDKIGKSAVYQSIMDNDYRYEEDDETDEKLNKNVIDFLKSDRKTGQQLCNALYSGESIKDDNGNEYDYNDGDLDLYDI